MEFRIANALLQKFLQTNMKLRFSRPSVKQVLLKWSTTSLVKIDCIVYFSKSYEQLMQSSSEAQQKLKSKVKKLM